MNPMLDDPDYQRFAAGQLKHCRCDDPYAPCAGVLAGGMCDEICDYYDEDERPCYRCWDTECYGDCDG